MQTPQKMFGFYRIKEGFRPDFADFKHDYAKKHAKRVVWLAKQDAGKTEYANVDPKGPEIHRMAKQMRRQNQDICGEMPVRNNQGELCLDDSERMKAWVEHYKGLLNVEFPWDEGEIPDAPPVEGPPPPITDKMVTKALSWNMAKFLRTGRWVLS